MSSTIPKAWTIQSPIATIHDAVTGMEAAGVKASERYHLIYGRWVEWRDYRPDHAGTIAREIVTGTPGDVPARDLKVLSSIQPNTLWAADVRNRVETIVAKALREEVATFRQPAYDDMAARFNMAAKALADVCAVVDPNTNPATLMDADETVRQAWAKVSEIVAELDLTSHTLVDIASLFGKDLDRFDLTVVAPDEPRSIRRKVWAAWDAPTERGGVWTNVLTVDGVHLEARPLDDVTPYRRPKPMATKYEAIGPGEYRPVEFDPELEDTQPGAVVSATRPKKKARA